MVSPPKIVPTNVREEVLCLSRLPSSKIPEIRISFLEIGPIFEPMDEAKSRPGVVHGADFIVDQAFQADFPNPICHDANFPGISDRSIKHNGHYRTLPLDLLAV